ncbi:MAG TPA: tetratricopeptide repeat protein [Geothrix sp.]|nr:tetratricopeptide repeat protein [Geothrix sp.]
MWPCSDRERAILGVVVLGCAPAALAQDKYQPDIKPADVQRMVQARELLRRGDAKGAAEALRQLTAAVPDYFLAHYNLGLALSNLGDNKGSLAALQKALALKEAKTLNEWSIYNSTGWAYMILGDDRRAEALLKVAEAHADKLPQGSQAKLWNNLGYLYMSRHAYSTARPYLERAKGLGSALAEDNLRVLQQLETSERSK